MILIPLSQKEDAIVLVINKMVQLLCCLGTWERFQIISSIWEQIRSPTLLLIYATDNKLFGSFYSGQGISHKHLLKTKRPQPIIYGTVDVMASSCPLRFACCCFYVWLFKTLNGPPERKNNPICLKNNKVVKKVFLKLKIHIFFNPSSNFGYTILSLTRK